MKNLLILLLSLFTILNQIVAQANTDQNPFRQLGQELPTPNTYRTASGAPGHNYFQNEADYKMNLTIDDDNQRLIGEETITYHNNAPDALPYLWLQLDQNVRARDSDSHLIKTNQLNDRTSLSSLATQEDKFDGGFKISSVTDVNGKALKYTINKTMMRIDLPSPLVSKNSFVFNIKWSYNINNTREIGGRSGYEFFEPDSNNVYVIAQFFPRLCAYNDVDGWQNKQFLGRGEFTLIFGDYDVNITVPSDHLVASTGLLQNPDKVLTKTQQSRIKDAYKEYKQPITIATYDEAEERISKKLTTTKTWNFKAENVRDFAFASSRRFIWDALGVKMSDGSTVLAQSMWTKEGNCLWSKYSTKAVAHTVKWYSHYTIDYPYPVAWSIDGNMGMEYPMICFNYGRCEADSTYSQRTKYGHIGVIIHEVGHNWFPMIINSDERQWTWMDEGLNTFVQYLTEQHWERDYPNRRGPAHLITDYMGGDKSRISPIMTNSESIFQFGNNAYSKPATALNILRETIMGRELFDYAFKEYCNRWKFKQPMPADFFRTMEDASGVDLDWFWRGWFFTNDHVDIAMGDVKSFKPSDLDPILKSQKAMAKRDLEPTNISKIRDLEQIKTTLADEDPSIIDYYTGYDPLKTDILDEQEYKEYLDGLTEEEKEFIQSGKEIYEISFTKKGGLVMPVIFQFVYEDGTTETIRIPAEIWRFGAETVTKTFTAAKAVKEIVLDPYLETADVDRSNNYFPPRTEESRFELFKKKNNVRENPMQRDIRARQTKVIRP